MTTRDMTGWQTAICKVESGGGHEEIIVRGHRLGPVERHERHGDVLAAGALLRRRERRKAAVDDASDAHHARVSARCRLRRRRQRSLSASSGVM